MTSATHARSTPPAIHDEMQQAESLLQGLSERIARLSLSLDLPLHDEQDIEKILHWHKELTPFDSPFKNREHRELQGLLVLRYHLEKTMVENLGFEKLVQVITHVETHLSQEGFQAGADGLQLSDFEVWTKK